MAMMAMAGIGGRGKDGGDGGNEYEDDMGARHGSNLHGV
jgi:hypothetical protein